MIRKNTVLFTVFSVLLASFGCATTATRLDPVELPTVGQIISEKGDKVPVDQAMEIAKRLRPNIPFANLNEVCGFASAKDKDPEKSRNDSLSAAIGVLSPTFFGASPDQPKRVVWWPSVDNETHYTMLCVVPPALAQKAARSLPGRHAPDTSSSERGPVIVQAEPVAPKIDEPQPVATKTVWDKAEQYKPGDSFVFSRQLCSKGRAEMHGPQMREAAKDNSSFMAANNLYIALKTQYGIEAYNGKTDELLENAVLKQWRQPSQGMEAVVCVALPGSTSVAAN